jgi:pyridoxamine 5'-phosphate oxidase
MLNKLQRKQMADKDFSEETALNDPFRQFEIWYKDHLSESNHIPESVYLGTASADGRVSVRTVLLKEFDERGFIFYTNYTSRKGFQLASNNYAALLFYWPEKDRQVRIEGKAEKLAASLSERYFSTRPRESQLSAWASEQSMEIPDREYLEKKFSHYKEAFSGLPVPKPDQWGGYRIVPEWFEFWQDREHRLHDRIVYIKEKDNWRITRLAP